MFLYLNRVIKTVKKYVLISNITWQQNILQCFFIIKQSNKSMVILIF